MTLATVDYEGISQVLRQAAAEQRSQLYEHECYALLKHLGAGAAHVNRLIHVGSRPTPAELEMIPGSKVVLKVVSPYITHKTEASGVTIVPREICAVEAAFDLMMRDVPDHSMDDFVLLSGTAVREMLGKGIAPPPEFSRPEVAKILSDYYQTLDA